MWRLVNVFRMSHILRRNLTKLIYVWKEKNPKLKIFISLLIQGKNHEIWNIHSNVVFTLPYVKNLFFVFKKKRYSETLINWGSKLFLSISSLSNTTDYLCVILVFALTANNKRLNTLQNIGNQLLQIYHSESHHLVSQDSNPTYFAERQYYHLEFIQVLFLQKLSIFRNITI